MSRYFAYGLLIFFTFAVLDVYCYEKCTHGFLYRYCSTGSCCKRNGTWYCVISLYDANCDSLAETTTRRPTTLIPQWTRAPRTPFPTKTTYSSGSSAVLPILLSIGAVVLIVMVFIIYLCIIRKSNGSQGKVIRRAVQHPSTNPVYFVNGTNEGQHLSSISSPNPIRTDVKNYIPPDTRLLTVVDGKYQLPPTIHNVQTRKNSSNTGNTMKNEGRNNIPLNTRSLASNGKYQVENSVKGYPIQRDNSKLYPLNINETGIYNTVQGRSQHQPSNGKNKWKNGVPSL